ncbi:CBS domain-containing protein [Bordetella bronchiseptica]|uniref:CBS domain-containing protein n=1 Tax=Bordetella bronchiseptica TaxID=518 RepID=UPI00045AFC4D|nr:CBS domain-containing protein [Bordetella bronchiseptica]KCV25661.1 CBS domain protein [Bordetella bronchiseptica 00-P-2730]KCV62847.1 CBS domain protein [Bordetella bronchiseptica 99-R-0433]
MVALDFMTPDPLCVNMRTPVSEIICMMLERSVSTVMVTADDGSLVGVVSEGDLIRRKDSAHQQRLDRWLDLLAEGEPLNLEFLHSLQLGRTTAAAIMTSPAITLDERATLAEIADVLLKHSIKRVPITRNGRLVGLVSRRDILRALMEQEDAPGRAGREQS